LVTRKRFMYLYIHLSPNLIFLGGNSVALRRRIAGVMAILIATSNLSLNLTSIVTFDNDSLVVPTSSFGSYCRRLSARLSFFKILTSRIS